MVINTLCCADIPFCILILYSTPGCLLWVLISFEVNFILQSFENYLHLPLRKIFLPLYNKINNQLDAAIIILLIISISSTCFGRWFRPSSGAADCVYSLRYNAPTVLSAGDVSPATSYKHSLVLLRMGEIIARNMLSWLKSLINRYCCI